MGITLAQAQVGFNKVVKIYCKAHGCHNSKSFLIQDLIDKHSPEKGLYDLPFKCKCKCTECTVVGAAKNGFT